MESGANGRIIPDHRAVAKINNTTEAIFDFELLNSQYGRTQNFFGYKINYRAIEIIEDELHFDYLLKDGICENKNATFIMKKMQII